MNNNPADELNDNKQGMTAEEFSSLTIGQLFDEVDRSGEELMFFTVNGEDTQPFALFAIAIGDPDRIEQIAKVLEGFRTTRRVLNG